jgi:hypothetical protein
MDAFINRSAKPYIHLLAVKATGAHGVKNHTLAVGVSVERKVIRVVIVTGAVVGTELMGLHAGSQKRQRINPKSAGFNQVCLFAGNRRPGSQDRQTRQGKNSKREAGIHIPIREICIW